MTDGPALPYRDDRKLWLYDSTDTRSTCTTGTGPTPPPESLLLPRPAHDLDLHTLRAWLNLQSVDTVAEVMAACVEELRQRRALSATSTTIPVSQDFGGREED